MLLEDPCFALTYDIGHDFCAGNGNKEFIIKRSDKLKHIHLHDATETRGHLTLGTGKIDITKELALVEKYSCRCVLETKTADALKQSVDYLRGVTKFKESEGCRKCSEQ